MKAYALDLRERVLRARRQGHSAHDVAKQLSLSKRSVERYWRRYQDTGKATALKMGGHRTSRLAAHDTTLRGRIVQRPDLTLSELQQRCREALQVRLGITALWHRLERLGLSYKKKLRAAEQTRPGLQAERVRWWLRQAQWDARRLVFLDETGLNTQMVRRYGRAPTARRCLDRVPHGHWRTATLLAALRHDRLTAPLLIDMAPGRGDVPGLRQRVSGADPATGRPGHL